MKDLIYDLETYPNVFTCCIKNVSTQNDTFIEVSEERNDFARLHKGLHQLATQRDYYRMFGFNNLWFDYPIVHELLLRLHPNALSTAVIRMAYNKAQKLIGADSNESFKQVIWHNNQLLPQGDLFQIHGKAASLKAIEFMMRSKNIQDLPFAPGTYLNPQDLKILREYNKHDVNETFKFYQESFEKIKMRERLGLKLDRNLLCSSDKNIGTQYLTMALEKGLGRSALYTYENKQRKPRQTHRSSIDIAPLILDCIQFERVEFQRVLDFLNIQHVTETSGVLSGLFTDVEGLRFEFGQGGLHASVESEAIYADDQHVIVDLDVTSYYPSLAIEHKFYPKHLGPSFCDIYARLKEERLTYPKDSDEYSMLKLSLNGVFGDSNYIRSCFYDPAYLLQTTINGQLLLCMLAEQLMRINGLRVIQANTDGVTVRLPKQHLDQLNAVCDQWQKITRLNLEQARYKSMYIRDVNNYLAQYTDGKIKAKGAYSFKRTWNQDHSALVVPQAVQAYLLDGYPIKPFIESHDDTFDFFKLCKVKREYRLELRDENPLTDITSSLQLQNVTRYCITNEGGRLVKIMPPLEGKTDERETSIEKGFYVTPCNVVDENTQLYINFDYYIEEALKLVAPFEQSIKHAEVA
jgi:hypothetical protein